MPDHRDDYFRLPGVVWLVLVPAGLALVTLAAFKPEVVPYDYLGSLGKFTLYLVRVHPQVLLGISTCAWIAHSFESWYAHKLCGQKNLSSEAKWKWTAQTFIYGMFSLKHLLNYEPKQKQT